MKLKDRFKKAIFVLSVVAACSAQAQLPDTDIFLAAINKGKDGKITFGKPENITNRKGYDNQPYFTPDGKSILYVSIQDSSLQADLYKYDLALRKSAPLLKTAESEYSPNITPDNKYLSFVRVNTDSTQKIYKAPMIGKGTAELISGTDSAGYYCWINDSVLAQFLIRDANALQTLNTKTGEGKLIASDAGRCIKLGADKRSLFFVLKNNPNEWTVMKMDINTLKLSPVIKTLHKSEDYCVLKDGTLLMGMGSKLYRFNPSIDQWWTEIADFKGTVNAFYRISINPAENKLALVAYIGDKP